MIVYSLACAQGHGFEGWFRDSAAYELQAQDGKLVCPVCNSRQVHKAPMAPAVAGTREKPAPSAPSADSLHQMRQYLTGLRKYIETHAENVGRDFPEEARKIHYGEVEERPIYGEASLGEARELIEEGISVAPLPPDVSDSN
ncbi:MAG: DUF1178 family protein [Alphaproteobacteria bacterium]|nr:DUF1178 family protein [Alphaproteobacteria bacterium]